MKTYKKFLEGYGLPEYGDQFAQVHKAIAQLNEAHALFISHDSKDNLKVWKRAIKEFNKSIKVYEKEVTQVWKNRMAIAHAEF
jgi:hypothetical protein